MRVPIPTPVLRFIHLDNLHIYLERNGLHAPNFWPEDGLDWKANHNLDIQANRRTTSVPCGPCGVIHDYVPFYFGPLSPMMLNLKTGRVPGYNEGQEPLIYLVATAQAIQECGAGFVFSDGHGSVLFTRWFDSLDHLDQVDWNVVNERYWKETVDDMDRKRRKQAEFLVYRSLPWSVIREIVVMDEARERMVMSIMSRFPKSRRKRVRIDREWYYW